MSFLSRKGLDIKTLNAEKEKENYEWPKKFTSMARLHIHKQEVENESWNFLNKVMLIKTWW